MDTLFNASIFLFKRKEMTSFNILPSKSVAIKFPSHRRVWNDVNIYIYIFIYDL